MGDLHMVREIVAKHMGGHPRTFYALCTEAPLRAAFEAQVTALTAMAQALREEGNTEFVVGAMVRATLERLHTDDLLARRRREVEAMGQAQVRVLRLPEVPS